MEGVIENSIEIAFILKKILRSLPDEYIKDIVCYSTNDSVKEIIKTTTDPYRYILDKAAYGMTECEYWNKCKYCKRHMSEYDPNEYESLLKAIIDDKISHFYVLPHAISDVSILPFNPSKKVVNGVVHKSYNFIKMLHSIKDPIVRNYSNFFFDRVTA